MIASIVFSLSDMMKREIGRIEAEIRQEQAEALGRTGECLERTLAELADLRKELLSIPDTAFPALGTAETGFSAVLQEKMKKYSWLCGEARHFRHCLIIQREAVGLRRHEDVDRQYPVPDPLMLSMTIRDRDKESL